MGQALDTAIAALERELDGFVDGTVPEQVVLVHRKITLQLQAVTVKRTPVRTGRARANWQLSIGEPAESEIGGFDDDSPGETTARGDAARDFAISAGQAAMQSLPPYSVSWLSNNLPYISVLEDGGYPNPPKGGEGKTAGGFSTQAPHGMLALAVDQVTTQFL